MHLSHYSTAGTVQYYKIREIPAYLIKLQNEALGGPPDRIFHDVNVSWQNCQKVLADNKELIPEFYFGDGSFLLNRSNADLSTNHVGEKVGNVGLPDWAPTATMFIIKMREALESSHVSRHLHKWIDLIFGVS